MAQFWTLAPLNMHKIKNITTFKIINIKNNIYIYYKHKAYAKIAGYLNLYLKMLISCYNTDISLYCELFLFYFYTGFKNSNGQIW